MPVLRVGEEEVRVVVAVANQKQSTDQEKQLETKRDLRVHSDVLKS